MELDIENETEIQTLKRAMAFLMEHAKRQQEEISALKEMISGVDGYSREFADNFNFDKFKSKFDEKLSPYNATFSITEKNPDYDFTRSVYDEYNGLSDEELKNTSEEDFVEIAIKKADDYINTVKERLSLPSDAKVEISTDENGNTEVKADVDGDGETEAIDKTEGEEEIKDEAKTEDTSEADEMEEIKKAVNG